MWTFIITAIALGPSALLVVWALWVHFTTDAPETDDFLDHRDTWGRQ